MEAGNSRTLTSHMVDRNPTTWAITCCLPGHALAGGWICRMSLDSLPGMELWDRVYAAVYEQQCQIPPVGFKPRKSNAPMFSLQMTLFGLESDSVFPPRSLHYYLWYLLLIPCIFKILLRLMFWRVVLTYIDEFIIVGRQLTWLLWPTPCRLLQPLFWCFQSVLERILSHDHLKTIMWHLFYLIN